MSEGVRPDVRMLPPPAEPYRSPEQQRREIARLAVEALGGDIVIQAKNEDGEVRTFVTTPRTGDRALDELIAHASIPVDYDIVGLEPTAADPAVEAALVAAAGQSGRRERRALLAERRRAAEEHFVTIEQEAITRWRARRQREGFTRYAVGRYRAALSRRAAKASRG